MSDLCKNCGAPLQDEAVFCSQCGMRADGKVACKNCGKFVPADAIYCTYCGKRVDGKVFCPNCNVEVEGAFCPQCGKKVAKTVNDVSTAGGADETENNAGGGFEVFKKTIKILSPALLLSSMVLLFALSFFIGVSLRADGRYEGGDISEILDFSELGAKNVFYYFGTVYDDLKSLYGSKLTFNEVFPVAMITFMLGVNLIVTFSMLVTAIVKYVYALHDKKSVNLLPYFGWAFAAFGLAAVCMLAVTGISLNYSEVYQSAKLSIGFNSAVKAGLITAAIISVVSLALTCVAKGKKILTFPSIGKIIFFTASAIFAAVAVSGVFGYKFFYRSYSENTSVTLSPGMLLVVIKDVFATEFPGKFNYAPYVISYVAFIGFAVCAAILLATVYGSIIKKKSGAGAVISSVLVMCFAIFYLVAALIVKQDVGVLIESKTSISIGRVIATLVLSASASGCGIAGVIISGKQKRA